MTGVSSSRTAQTGDPTPVPFPFALFDMSGSGAGPWVMQVIGVDPNSNAVILPAKDSSVTAFGGTVVAPSTAIQTFQGNPLGIAVPMTRYGAQITVTPTVTVGAYTSGNVIGGIMTFANILPASLMATLQSITLKFKGTVQTVEFDLGIFSASPTGTFADHGAPAIASTDTALLLGTFALTANLSPFGTHTTYNLNGINKMLTGTSTSLYAVMIAKSAPVNPASASEMSLTLATVW